MSPLLPAPRPGSALDSDPQETWEWLEALDDVLHCDGSQRCVELLGSLLEHARSRGVTVNPILNTPYCNTISRSEEPAYPGDLKLEERITAMVRWNALVMVVRANQHGSELGGHLSSYASGADLFEVGFNHFFRGNLLEPDSERTADLVFFQPHSAPGIYARAFLEGRLSENHLGSFRREVGGQGLSSYPHPWLMPEFWQFPTGSMGLGPLTAVYQARFMHYLWNRGLLNVQDRKVWAFVGDGEMDEPESIAGLTLAARENLENLIVVVNCNLQRLDGPVRGNGKIVQELEAIFRGAGWNVIKVLWGDSWDPLLARDEDGALVKRMEEAVDGDFQKYSVEPGSYTREHFFGTHPRLRKLVEGLTDEEIAKLRRGGHDPEKVYAAYKVATEHRGQPSVILAQTIKGYGLGEAGEGKNITHQQKKLNYEELREFRARFGIPVSDEALGQAPFYKPAADSPEMRYLHARRKQLGGFVPSRRQRAAALEPAPSELFEEFYGGSEGREASTTMVFVRLLSKLLRDERLGPLIVPIVPDEARTFGMESLFRQVGIYSHVGQRYEPVDRETLLYYKEATDGQILEEGITEAGSVCSFIAAGTAHVSHGVNTIPFFIFYSMFGFQRIGDLIWAAGDMGCRGFLLGGTAGRTTLAGEGLQHQDGHSHLLAYTHPHVLAYDPAFAYELAVIVREGIRRMYVEGESICYYLTVGNEPYSMPPLPEGVEEGILRGLYRLKGGTGDWAHSVRLLGSGAIMNEVLLAQRMLADDFGVDSEVWAATSYQQLHREALEVERRNRLHPLEPAAESWVRRCLGDDPQGVVVAASDYVKALPASLGPWIAGRFVALGTDGFGRSDSRAALRDHFEVDARHVTWATLAILARAGKFPAKRLVEARSALAIDPDKPDPAALV